MKEKILGWVAGQKNLLEQAIVDAARLYFDSKNQDNQYANVAFDLQQSYKECRALSDGGDWCYDRFTSGVYYSLYYQGRRINTSLSFAADFVVDAIEQKRRIEIFDLGAGTGAVHIAVCLCVDAAIRLGYSLPAIRLINIDISPFMLNYASSYLIKTLKGSFPQGFSHVISEYEAVSWTNQHDIQLRNPYIIASYVFDHSDNREEVGATLLGVVQRFNPRQLVLITSWKKKELARSYANEFLDDKIYIKGEYKDWNPVFSGPMEVVQNYRKEITAKHDISLGIDAFVKWDFRSFFALKVTKKVAEFVFEELEQEETQIDLYRPPVKIRRDISLNDLQRKAAKPNNSPTIILGSAGSGKSVVITERVKNVIEAKNYSQDLRILITSFNLELIKYLGNWMGNLLDETRYTRGGNDQEHFFFDGSKTPNLTILNFDKLPTRLGKFHGNLCTSFRYDIKPRFLKAIEIVSQEIDVNIARRAELLEPHFLYQEYVRVVYGQLYLDEESYQNGKRSGRPYLLQLNSQERKVIWKVIRQFLILLDEGLVGHFNPADTIHTKRQKLYRKLVNREIATYSHIFVDEFQDCTNADYQLFYGLIDNNNELVLAGDYAQAVHLGASVAAPREGDEFAGEERMGNRQIHRLAGSYRLPFRITECIKPLSQAINNTRKDVDVNVINPYKGAPPGARPILVYAASEQEMAKKMSWIHFHYQIFDFEKFGAHQRKQITILEGDKSLCKQLNEMYTDIATTDTILRLKGMEKDCIVWSTRKEVESPGDEDYYVYTILTRTRSILIVALFNETIPRYREIVKMFPKDRLIIWDAETERHYQEEVLNMPPKKITV